MTLRILCIGDFSPGNKTEGMRIISKTIFTMEIDGIEKKAINPKDILKPHAIRDIRKFKPDVIHYLTGPTIKSLLILRILQMQNNNAKTISSAVRPFFSPFARKFLSLCKPDLMLTQDPLWEKAFIDSGINTSFLPNGIYTEKFHPVDNETKERLVKKFNLPEGRKIVLHVGHIRENRNLGILTALQRTGFYQVFLLASPSFPADRRIYNDLISAGCIILREYISSVEEIYQAADYYLFPTIMRKNNELPSKYNEVGVIDIPLSILEAMSCNKAIISTAVPSLQRYIDEGGGLLWFDGTITDLLRKLDSLDSIVVNTREKIKKYSWDWVKKELHEKYLELLGDG